MTSGLLPVVVRAFHRLIVEASCGSRTFLNWDGSCRAGTFFLNFKYYPVFDTNPDNAFKTVLVRSSKFFVSLSHCYTLSIHTHAGIRHDISISIKR